MVQYNVIFVSVTLLNEELILGKYRPQWVNRSVTEIQIKVTKELGQSVFLLPFIGIRFQIERLPVDTYDKTQCELLSWCQILFQGQPQSLSNIKTLAADQDLATSCSGTCAKPKTTDYH